MGILSRIFGRGGDAGSEALRRGVTVSRVERELPIFRGNNTLESLTRGECVRYSIPRSGGRSPSQWSFLQRGKGTDGYPNGWQFLSDAGPPSTGLKEILMKIAVEWTEEFLEFDADPNRVSAYWEEWGGEKQAAKVIGYLENLARA